MKKIILITLCLVMLAQIGASAKTLEFTIEKNSMFERTDAVSLHELEASPYIKNGRTMIPVRIISENFGASVDWNEKTREVTIKKDDRKIVLSIGKDSARVNGEKILLDAAPEIEEGRTMVPLRFISETLGMNAKYVPSTRQVLISDEKALITVNGKDITADDFISFLTYAGYNPEVDKPEDVIPFVADFLTKNYALSDYVKQNEIDSITDPTSEIRSSLEEISEFIYQDALVAPLAQLMENEFIASASIYSSLDDGKAELLAKEGYSKNYVTAKHILISSETIGKESAKKEAQKILGTIHKGADFDELMKKHSDDPGLAQFPDGYTFTKGEMVKEFEEAAFSLKEGHVSGLVETSYGYHIIKREALPDPDPNLLNALIQKISSDMYNKLSMTAIEESDIKYHYSLDEIIVAFKNKK